MKHAELLALRETKRADTDLTQIALDGTFSGYASIFGETDLGNDIVMPGAFAKSLVRRGPGGIRMLFQHDANQPIGTWSQVAEDEAGLHVTGHLATATERGREVLELMRAGAVDGLSIGFRTIRSRIDKASGARRILEADLWEISVVTFPMQPDARVSAIKSTGAGSARPLPSTREFEHWLQRDAGLTRSEARIVITKGFANLPGQRDAAGDERIDPALRMAAAVRSINRTLNQRN